MQEPAESSYKLTSLKRSTIAISSVVLVEVILGLAAGSLAIVSDGLHASLDAVTTLILFLATRASLKPPDEEHMYGHEKFEAIGGLTGGVALIGIALLIMYEAVVKIMQSTSINPELEYAGFIALGYTFAIDFFRVGTLGKARKSNSATMKAGFYHAFADLSSTVIAFLGFGLATLGMRWGDALASIVLGVMLSYLSIRVIRSSGMELSDATSKDLTEKIRKIIASTEGVSKCQSLRVRRAGAKTFVEATVQVPDYMSLEDAHALASRIEENVKKSLENADIIIHIEPSEAKAQTEKLLEKLATEVDGVKEVHEISAVYASGKLYITLHARVDPRLSVHEAHEIAEKIENKIQGTLRGAENVTVHVEPYDAEVQKGVALAEDEVCRIINHVMRDYRQVVHVGRIVTYVADEKRYINVDCSFSERISVEEAHRIASLMEMAIKEHFAETIVTVHMEPR
jgi:cation diffusion facilitator family transporter